MGKIYVLKDKSGHATGYLMQGMGRIRCKAVHQGDAQVTLLYDDAGTQTHALDGEEENAWPDAGHSVAAAYVTSGDKLLMDTGEAGRHAYEVWKGRRIQPRTSLKDDVHAPESTQERPREAACEQQASAQGMHAQMERRWPPPPCWPEARYIQGRWTQSLTSSEV